MIDVRHAVGEHAPGQCKCVIHPRCLREMRRRREAALEPIGASCGCSIGYLTRLELGHERGCVTPKIVHAYERIMQTKVDTEMLAILSDALDSLALVQDWLSRRHLVRTK